MWRLINWKEGSKINQIWFAVLICVPVFCYGTAVGWMSPTILLLQSDKSPSGKPMTDKEISWIASTCFLVSMPSNIVFGYICDKWGRKISIMICSVHICACWIIKLVSTSLWAFILARAMVGVAVSGSYIVSLIYIKEISEDCIRGVLATLGILSQTIGNLLLYILGDLLSYRTILWFCLSIPTIHLVLFMWMPESPAFLIKKGKLDEAVRVIAWLRSRKATDPIIADHMQELIAEQEKMDASKQFVLRTVLANKLTRRAFYIALSLTIGREICGVIAILNYAGDIFKMASEGGSSLFLQPNMQAIVLGVVQVLGCILASSLVDRIGRKPLLIVSSFIAGLSTCVLASWFLAKHLGHHSVPWVPIVTLCFCIFCDSSGLQPVCLVVLSELFAFQFRSSMLAVTMCVSDTADFLMILLFKRLASSVGIYLCFYFFALVCLVSSLYITVIVPETKMRTLDQIYERLYTKKERLAAKPL